MRSIINIFVFIGVIYFCLCLLAYIFQEKLLFFPTRIDESFSYLKDYRDNEIIIKHRNVELHGWLINPDKSTLIIYYGGNAEEVSLNIDDFVNNLDCTVLLINYRGYGRSNGSPSQKNLFADALYVYDYVVNEIEQKYDRIILFGRSLGAGIAIYLASERKVDRMILISPYDSIVNVAKGHYPILPVKMLLRHPFNSMSYIRNVHVPILVIAAEKDDIIPYKHTKNLVDQLGERCSEVVIKGAEHNDVHLKPLYWESIKNFIKK
jgi:alpha-beta hydrolase superfamily lysophospholipase